MSRNLHPGFVVCLHFEQRLTRLILRNFVNDSVVCGAEQNQIAVVVTLRRSQWGIAARSTPLPLATICASSPIITAPSAFSRSWLSGR